MPHVVGKPSTTYWTSQLGNNTLSVVFGNSSVSGGGYVFTFASVVGTPSELPRMIESACGAPLYFHGSGLSMTGGVFIHVLDKSNIVEV